MNFQTDFDFFISALKQNKKSNFEIFLSDHKDSIYDMAAVSMHNSKLQLDLTSASVFSAVEENLKKFNILLYLCNRFVFLRKILLFRIISNYNKIKENVVKLDSITKKHYHLIKNNYLLLGKMEHDIKQKSQVLSACVQSIEKKIGENKSNSTEWLNNGAIDLKEYLDVLEIIISSIGVILNSSGKVMNEMLSTTAAISVWQSKVELCLTPNNSFDSKSIYSENEKLYLKINTLQQTMNSDIIKRKNSFDRLRMLINILLYRWKNMNF
ncbi:MAG: hypothetical protein LBO74_04805 [Candidatus Symbiothrix sp.]|jgi:hypothetical protein|nr:hypothetical protein [Candidatus Symbiothrix sp.]